MKITMLGTGCGKEINPERNQSAFTVESNGKVYWFDAGESCSRNAMKADVNLCQVRSVFISHPAMDHVAGLPGLLWRMRKACAADESCCDNGHHISVLMPYYPAWQGILGMVESASKNCFANNLLLEIDIFYSGDIYEDSDVKVSSCATTHFPVPGKINQFASYAFRLEAEGKSVVYSGDVNDVAEVLPFASGCDLLVLDASHIDNEKTCQAIAAMDGKVGKILFTHVDNAFEAGFGGVESMFKDKVGVDCQLAQDGLVLEL